MAQHTPKSVFDLYCLLPDADKRSFLELLGGVCTAEVPFLIANELHVIEKKRFSDMVFQEVTWQIFPWLQQEARRLAREKPHLTDEEFDREFHDHIKEYMERYDRDIGELERAKLKDERDPKPRNTERDDEIVRLRDKEGKTFGQIGRLLVQRNPLWCGKDGKQLPRDTVERAYRRRKGLGTN